MTWVHTKRKEKKEKRTKWITIKFIILRNWNNKNETFEATLLFHIYFLEFKRSMSYNRYD